MSASLGQAVVLLLHTLGSLYLLAILLRFLLQAVRADFYNPVTQAIVKITNAPLRPFRRFIPGYRGFDFASLTMALVFSTLASYLMLFIFGIMLPPVTVIGWAALGIFQYVLKVYFFGAIISVIASFIAPYSGHPALLVIHELLDPAYRMFRKVLPPMGGLDFSPLFIFLGIRFIETGLLYPMVVNLGMAQAISNHFVLGFW